MLYVWLLRWSVPVEINIPSYARLQINVRSGNYVSEGKACIGRAFIQD